MTEPISQLLSLLQLEKRARESRNIESLGFVMVNETQQVLQYRQAALWFTQSSASNSELNLSGLGFKLGNVKAVSGLPQPNPSAPYTHWLSLLFNEISKRDTNNSVFILTALDVPNLADDWGDWLPAYVLWIPLKLTEKPLLGGLLLARESAWQEHDLAIANELASSYGHTLALLVQQKQHDSSLSHVLSKFKLSALKTRFKSNAKQRTWFFIALLGLMFFPVQQSALAPAEVVPKNPFIVRAPQDGVVERMLIQPNQQVSAGTPLFNLDQTALQTRYDVARKAYDTAEESYRQSAQMAVTESKGKLEMGLQQGALEEKSVELAYTADLLGRVQVEAPQAGIAVFSDINDWQGKAVATGERIVTLADPANIEIAIYLPVGERFDAKIGAKVTMYPNASPLSTYDAVVSKIAYSAEPTRDGQVAYLIKANLNANEALPRIGLSGTARLQGNRVPLIYYALRRPLTAVRQWLGV